MNQFEQLVEEAEKDGITIIEKIFDSTSKGLIKGNKIAIRKDIPTLCEKSCILAEELGHYFTAVGNIVNIKDVSKRKQELKGRKWSFDRMVGLVGIINAFNNNCTNLYEMAEFLNVTETFLKECITYYRAKYGIYKEIDNYIIYFEPCLGVLKLIQ